VGIRAVADIRAVALVVVVALVGLSGTASGAGPTPTSTSTSTPTPAQPAVSVPPDLLALEQKLLGLHLRSERFRDQETLVRPASAGATPQATSKSVAVTATGAFSISPLRADYSFSLGNAKSGVRLVGKARYIYEPAVAHRDGGRPWVRLTQKSDAPVLGITIGPSKPPPGDSTSTFPKLIAQVNAGQSLTEVGAQTVDGQAVTEFTALVNVREPTANSLLQFAEFGAAAEAMTPLQLYLAPDGLPVSIRYALRSASVEWTSSQDILAINTRVVVHAPPSRLTIGEAQLSALEARQQRRAEAKLEQRARRRCKEPSMRHRPECKFLNKTPAGKSTRLDRRPRVSAAGGDGAWRAPKWLGGVGTAGPGYH
jgi:hypothetical protein